MADAPITFRIFLSSPGDVAEERAKARDLLLGLARGPFLRDKVHIDVVTWDDPFAPAPMDGRYSPQQAVDRGLPTPDQCDLTIVLLWSRMGTPLEEKKADGTPYRSGTEWEFEKALGANRPVLVYRRTEKVLLDPDAEDFQARVEQRQRLNEFFDGFKGTGGTLKRSFTPYGSPQELLGRVERDIEHYLHRALEQVAAQKRANTDTDSRAGTAAPGGQVATPTRSAPPPPEVPAAYRAWVVRMHGGIDLLGLRLRKARPPSLASIYVPQTTLVTEQVLTTDRKRRPIIDVDMQGRGRDAERRVLVLTQLASQSLFVSGAPGTGKSTFCRRVACLVAEGAPADQGSMSQEFTEELGDELKGRLPLLLKLRELTDYLPSKRSFTPSDVLDAIERWVTSRQPDGLHPALVRAHLDSGSALVILDGMDEVPVSQTSSSLTWHPRAQLIDVLGELTSRWSKSGNRLLVTSRPYGLSAEEARRLQLVAAPLQPLPDTLQRELATRWFAA